ncbi:hypothetical protein OH492_20675 [Vibrio chagasii]|nr:hypothetical protein [Vibrio chagasii]
MHGEERSETILVPTALHTSVDRSDQIQHESRRLAAELNGRHMDQFTLSAQTDLCNNNTANLRFSIK